MARPPSPPPGSKPWFAEMDAILDYFDAQITTLGSPLGLFNSLAGTPPTIGGTVTVVSSTGYSAGGTGAATYIYDAAVNGAYVTANPRTSFLAVGGRGFRLVARNVNPFMFGAIGDGTTNDATAFQAFLDYITANDVGVADVAGSFATSTQLSFGTSVLAATKRVVGRCKLVATAGSSGTSILKIVNWIDGHWDHLDITGTGVLGTYSTKTWAVGLFMGGERCSFGKISTKMFSFAGVAEIPTNTTSGNSYGLMKPSDCGSGARAGATKYGLTGSWSSPSRAGSVNSVNQTTTITVDVLPPSYVTSNTFGNVGNTPYMIRVTQSDGSTRLHYINSVNTGASQLTVYPWIEAAATPGVFEYVYGGGLHNMGANGNVVSFDLIDAVRCGIALAAGSLYGPVGKRVITQNCGCGVLIGCVPNGATLGTRIDGTYFENAIENIVYLARPVVGPSNVYGWFGSEYAQDLSKCYVAGAPRTTGDADYAPYSSFAKVTLAYQGTNLRPEKSPFNFPYGNSTQALILDQANQVFSLAGDTFTIGITLDKDLHRLTGFDTGRVVVVGTGPNGAPTGSLTFTAPATYTINGGAGPVVFSGFLGVAEFIYRFDVVNLNVIVTLARGVFPRVATVASAANPAINTDTTDLFKITAQAAAVTSMTTNLTGTPVDGQRLMIRIKDNGTARAITWGASFTSSGVATLPTTTVISKQHTVGLVWDATAAKWVCLAVDAVGY